MIILFLPIYIFFNINSLRTQMFNFIPRDCTITQLCLLILTVTVKQIESCCPFIQIYGNIETSGFSSLSIQKLVSTSIETQPIDRNRLQAKTELLLFHLQFP